MRMAPYGFARAMLGLQEVRDRKKLMEFFKANGVDCDPKTTAWCAAFVNACERAAGYGGTGALNARSFLTYGKEVDGNDVEVGDIIIFERNNDGYSGHVAYFVKWDDEHNTVVTLGGNQSDMVCEREYIQDKILGIRRS